MQRRWFRRFGWEYRPVLATGWGIVVVTAGLIVRVFLAIDRHSHSASDTLWGVFPYAVCFLVLAYWVAAHTCGEEER